MEKKIINPKTYLYNEGKTTLRRIMEYADKKVDGVYSQAQKQGLVPDGPLEFIYFGATPDQDKEFTLQIALPIQNTNSVDEGFAIKTSTNFSCLVETHKGNIEGIGQTYEKVYEHLWNNSLKPNDEIREVYHVYEGPHADSNVTEIQVGLL